MPAGGALFGSSATRSQNKNLVEFKAGKMTMKGKMVHPDKRKGLVYVYQSEDSLMHFCWKDRTSGTVEDDLIIFPDDCEFKKVAQCTTGRVYVLKFKSSNRKFFFWLQEPKTDKDEDNARKINEVLNNPPTPGSQRSGGATPDENLQNLLQNMSQQQLMQLFGGVGQMGGLSSLLGTISRPSTSQGRPSSTTGGSSSSSATTAAPKPAAAPAPSPPRAKPPAASAETPAQNPIQLSDLQNFLSGLGVAGTPGSSAPQNVDLSSAINTETLSAVVNNPAVVEELQQHLPSTGGEASQQEHLRSTLASPQFQQAVSLFSTALQSGQLGPIVSQFEVGPEAVSAANQGNMEDFVKALQNTSINTSGSDPSQPEKRRKTEDKKKDDDDEDMALD
ncbi:proteasomal ubiquitin receptor ADRM1 isoform X2 [Homalodisca vitripennis]|uniref:proteasomal ubiquitin receptor ADRM1 isoform X2 n=1 Tax=Homalodisca vitripennis TaxID=197043 RepID=UPI001EEA4F9F|nr:proteasomal ubiquitin receptor ADRM1 isoform X2 [Homalodisca vitripennis]